MLTLISEITFIIIIAVLLGIAIGYSLAKSPCQEEEEEIMLNNDLDVDSCTGIVSDASFNKRR